MTTPRDEILTLDNCDKEPIHIPGRIQAHGALFAFDPAGILQFRSVNAQALLGAGLPELGDKLHAGHFSTYPGVHELLAQVLEAQDTGALGHATEIQGPGGSFNLIAHLTGRGVICEFEDSANAVALTADFPFRAHRAMERLRGQTTVQGLLAAGVDEIRRLTGFDRVMAYRFRHDDSGEVVAESAASALEPFIGRRYPAGDIPAQARRLYVINTLRLIADVHAGPVAVEAFNATGEPLDMSHGVLRSVSPVHIEYLTNMGVGASMSISIVIGGRLWGMLACHHMTARRVPYTARMACDVLAQILGSNIHAALSRLQSARSDKAASVRSHLLAQILDAQDINTALSAEARLLCDGFGAHGVVLTNGANVEVHASLSATTATALVQWLNAGSPVAGRMVHLSMLDAMPAGLREQMGSWCGVLALPFGIESLCWLILLRKEEVKTVVWGGQPDKVYTVGPLGPRLTPRGSFDLWREIVKGHAVPWDDADLDSAEKLLDRLLWADAAHIAETTRARIQLMAMLGHDLRDPLQSISNTARLLTQKGLDGGLGQRIHSSSQRMQRLIGQVMDMSGLQSGGLSFHMQPMDLVAALHESIAESRAARPGVKIEPIAPRHLLVDADGDRLAQVMANLLSNASQHGTPGTSVLVQLSEKNAMAVLEVSNEGKRPSDAVAATLFQPFKRGDAVTMTNRNGLGLGLYIAQQLMAGHGGSISFNYEDPYVVFTATFPVRRAVVPE